MKIITDTDRLRLPCEPVKSLKEGLEIARRITDALRTFNKRASRPLSHNEAKAGLCRQRGVGLAANQLGISKQVAVLMIRDVPTVLINPRIIEHSPAKISAQEACLSMPGQEFQTFRHPWVTVTSLNTDEPLTFGVKDPMAWRLMTLLTSVVAQHEIAHLFGLLPTDFLTREGPDPLTWENHHERRNADGAEVRRSELHEQGAWVS